MLRLLVEARFTSMSCHDINAFSSRKARFGFFFGERLRRLSFDSVCRLVSVDRTMSMRFEFLASCTLFGRSVARRTLPTSLSLSDPSRSHVYATFSTPSPTTNIQLPRFVYSVRFYMFSTIVTVIPVLMYTAACERILFDNTLCSTDF